MTSKYSLNFRTHPSPNISDTFKNNLPSFLYHSLNLGFKTLWYLNSSCLEYRSFKKETQPIVTTSGENQTKTIQSSSSLDIRLFNLFLGTHVIYFAWDSQPVVSLGFITGFLFNELWCYFTGFSKAEEEYVKESTKFP